MVSSKNSNVVASGLGFVTSIGNNRSEVKESLLNLRHGLKPVTFLDNPDIPVKVAGLIDGFDVSSPYYQKWTYPESCHIPKELIRGMPPHGVYAYCAIEQALEDAGLTIEDLRDERTALYCASAGSAFLLGHHLQEMQRNRGMRGSPFGVVSTIAGALNFNLGTHFGIRGGNCGFVSACSSSTHAMGFAYDQIALGRVDRVIVVGAEDINAESVLPFSAMRALSNQKDPILASCPFDKSRNGFVASGGAVAVILENASIRRERKGHVYGEVMGWHQTSDGYNPAISEPEGRGLASCMEQLLQATGIRAGDVDYINAHATSTVQGDKSEGIAIQKIFGDNGAHPYVSSTKALTGHPLSMAGAMEAAFCFLAIKEGFIPGAAHLREVDEAMKGLNFPEKTLQEIPEIILSNSSGFGGSNVCLMLKKWT